MGDRIDSDLTDADTAAIGKNIRQTTNGGAEVHVTVKAEDATRADIYREVLAMNNLFHEFRSNALLQIWGIGFVLLLAIFLSVMFYWDMAISIRELSEKLEQIQNYLPTPTPYPWDTRP